MIFRCPTCGHHTLDRDPGDIDFGDVAAAIDRCIELSREGLSAREISARLGWPIDTVLYAIALDGVEVGEIHRGRTS